MGIEQSRLALECSMQKNRRLMKIKMKMKMKIKMN